MEICRFALDNGDRCQAPARRNRPFCRHHDPEPYDPSPFGLSRTALPKRAPADYRDSWRRMHEWIAVADEPSLDAYMENVMIVLGEGGLTHRRAGGLFAAIQSRRRQLAAESLDRLRDVILAFAALGTPPPEAFDDTDLPHFQLVRGEFPVYKNAISPKIKCLPPG